MNLDNVTAAVSRRSQASSPAQTYVTDRNLMWRFGLFNLNQVLSFTPGWFVSREEVGDYPVYSARGYLPTGAGMPQSYLLFMQDFYRLNEFELYGHYYGEAFRDYRAYDRVEVVNGPGGSLYGDNAVAGVVNAITVPTSSRGGNEAGARYESGLNRATLSYSYRKAFSPDLSLALTLSYFNARGAYRTGNRGAFVTDGSPVYVERSPLLQGHDQWDTGDRQFPNVIGKLKYGDFSFDLWSQGVYRKGLSDDWALYDAFNRGASSRLRLNQLYAVKYAPGDLADSYAPELMLSYRRFYDQETGIYYGGVVTSTSDVPANTEWKNSFRTGVHSSFQLFPYRSDTSRLLFKVNYFRQLEFDYTYAFKSPSGSVSGFSRTGSSSHYTKAGALFQLENSAIQDAIITGGVRYDYVKPYDNHGKVLHYYSPRISVNYNRGQDRYRLIAARAYRSLGASELGFDTNAGAFTRGNLSKGDRTDDLEVSYGRDITDAQNADVNLYMMRTPYSFIDLNHSSGRSRFTSRGVEALYRVKGLVPDHWAEVSYSFCHAESDAGKRYGLNRVPAFPRSMLKAKWAGPLARGVDYAVFYHGYYGISNYDWDTAAGAFVRRSRDGKEHLDFIDVTFSSDQVLRLNWRFGIKNLLDVRKLDPAMGPQVYAGADGYLDGRTNLPGISFFAEAGYRF